MMTACNTLICRLLRRLGLLRDSRYDLERHKRTAQKLRMAVKASRRSGNFAADMIDGTFDQEYER